MQPINERQPGLDLASKNLLKHKEVVGGEAYTLAETHWFDGSISDVVKAKKAEAHL